MTPPRQPVLLLVAHGSRDPRHAAVVSGLTTALRGLRPDLAVTAGYLDHCAPRLPQVLERLWSDDPERPVIAVPLLLNRAFHAKHDIPGVLAEATSRLPGLDVRLADVLGPHPLLLAALDRRLAEAGVHPSPGTGIVLAAAGSSDPAANAATRGVAAAYRATRGWAAVEVAYASASGPRVPDAIAALRAAGATRIAVAPYLLAPGLLPDRIAAATTDAPGAATLAAPLGPAPELARLLLTRYTGCAELPRGALEYAAGL
ncbi:sirohydrochlorin chelatase [Phaeacidiphilus oryzae]|uniref:sirohydrochlorin chelatase n=1 Tax=Phaeacidiphilus oryzae TaxID=348818 RepID=UPI00056C3854|nr:sirohydrochlorin chelatase [Phaeacidiphilus oryzae]